MNVHFPWGNLGIGVEKAETLTVEGVCRPAILRCVVDPGNLAGILVRVKVSKVENGSALPLGIGKDGLDKLFHDVVEEIVLVFRLDAVVGAVADTDHAV